MGCYPTNAPRIFLTQIVRVVTPRLEFHLVNHVDHPDFQLGKSVRGNSIAAP